MLRLAAGLFISFFVFMSAYAEDIVTDIGHNGHVDHVTISNGANGKIVKIYDGQKLLGSFDNLIVDQSSISSTIVPMLGGGIAISGDSDGSRDKYHIVAPIYKNGDKFFVRCVYKAVYDSVDENRSVGSTCENTELSKFDISNAITSNGLMAYKDDQDWLKGFSIKNCKDPSGFKYDDYYVIRCSPAGAGDVKNASVTLADSSKSILFTLTGFDIFPDQALGPGGFFLNADLLDQTIPFYGALACFKSGEASNGGSRRAAKMGGRLSISYDLSTTSQDCLVGHYSYASKNIPINLSGTVHAGMGYLLERSKDGDATGLFVLNQFSGPLQGVWVGIPPKKPLTVN
jgi:hypothetical protein